MRQRSFSECIRYVFVENIKLRIAIVLLGISIVMLVTLEPRHSEIHLYYNDTIVERWEGHRWEEEDGLITIYPYNSPNEIRKLKPGEYIKVVNVYPKEDNE